MPARALSTHSTEALLCLHTEGENATLSRAGKLYQLVTCPFEKTALHFLPIAPLPYFKVLSQGWAVEQTTGSFLFPHLRSSSDTFCRPRDSAGCSQVLQTEPGSESQLSLGTLPSTQPTLKVASVFSQLNCQSESPCGLPPS